MQHNASVLGTRARSELVVPARKRGEEEAGDLLVNLNARIPKHLWRRVRLRCLREGRLLRTFITEALGEHLVKARR